MGGIEKRYVPELQAILQEVDVLVLLGVCAGVDDGQDEVVELRGLWTIALWEHIILWQLGNDFISRSL